MQSTVINEVIDCSLISCLMVPKLAFLFTSTYTYAVSFIFLPTEVRVHLDGSLISKFQYTADVIRVIQDPYYRLEQTGKSAIVLFLSFLFFNKKITIYMYRTKNM